MTLLVSMPVWNIPEPLLKKAVDSILDQTYYDVEILAYVDGVDKTSYDFLKDMAVDDIRLHVHMAQENRGRYFADAVALKVAYDDPDFEWFSVHDADDWSENDRYEQMIGVGENEGAEAVIAGHTFHNRHGDVKIKVPDIQSPIGQGLRHVAHHTGLFRPRSLSEKVGGPHPDWRIAYDTLMMALVVSRLKCVAIKNTGYHHVYRRESLSQSRETGMSSRARQEVHVYRRGLWLKLRGRSNPVPGLKISPSTLEMVDREASLIEEQMARDNG